MERGKREERERREREEEGKWRNSEVDSEEKNYVKERKTRYKYSFSKWEVPAGSAAWY